MGFDFREGYLDATVVNYGKEDADGDGAEYPPLVPGATGYGLQQ
jgi:hypothetical protein